MLIDETGVVANVFAYPENDLGFICYSPVAGKEIENKELLLQVAKDLVASDEDPVLEPDPSSPSFGAPIIID